MQDFCRGQISRYKIPKHIAFVESYPMTASGKIQKFKLRELAAELFPQAMQEAPKIGLREEPGQKDQEEQMGEAGPRHEDRQGEPARNQQIGSPMPGCGEGQGSAAGSGTPQGSGPRATLRLSVHLLQQC